MRKLQKLIFQKRLFVKLIFGYFLIGIAYGQEQLENVVLLRDLSIKLYKEGRYYEAIPLAEKYLFILEKSYGNSALRLAPAINNLAELYRASGNLPKAEKLHNRALSIREKELESNHPDVAVSLQNLGLVYYDIGEYQRAEALYKRSLAIWEKAHGGDHPDMAQPLDNLGCLYHKMGEYKRAEALHKKSLAIWEKARGGDHLDMAQSLNNLATLYGDMGDYSRSESLHKRSMELWEKAFGYESANVAISLHNLAWLQQKRGKYIQAEALYKQSLAIKVKVLGGSHPNVAISLNNIGRLYMEIGDYEKAELLFKKSLMIVEKTLGVEHPKIAENLNNLATLYYSMGDYNRVEDLYKKSLAILNQALGPGHQSVNAIKNNIGCLYLDQGKLDDAYHIFMEKEEDNWSNIRAKMEDLNFGQDKIDGVYRVFKEIKKNEWSIGLGRYYILRGNYKDAVFHFQKDIKHRKKEPDITSMVGSSIGLGLSLEGMKKFQEAAEAFEVAVELIEEQRAELMSAEKTHFLNALVGPGFKRIEAYEGLVRVKAKAQEPKGAFFWSEHTKARLLLDAISMGKTSGTLPADLSHQEQELFTAFVSLYRQRETAFNKNPEMFKKIEEQDLPKVKKELSQFVDKLRSEQPLYAAVHYPQPLGVSQLRLNPKESLIAYEVTESETFGWLIREGKVITSLYIPITRKELIEQVKGYRSCFEKVSSYEQLSRFDPTLGHKLYELLFKGFAGHLTAGEPVVIVPDEILGVLPFEALVVEPPSKVNWVKGRYGSYPQGVIYLGDVYPVSYSQSATTLTLSRTLQKAAGAVSDKMLVVADPVFELSDERVQGRKDLIAQQPDESRMRLMRVVGENLQGSKAKTELPRLSSTSRLGEKLRRSYGSNLEVLQGLDASEPELRKRPLESYGYQVFATHGILDNEVAYIQEPALVLCQIGADPQESEKDGFLTMSEVMGLKLKAQMVALTACNTGVGKQLTGEGVMGLGRAFQYAGAQSVLMSLWSVEDESTNLLTERLFSHLKSGKSRMEALRLARSDLRQAGYEHPFFWAPFILVGEG
jgi:CHAT domain-containing protein/Tfp pilus assembly protein PilF